MKKILKIISIFLGSLLFSVVIISGMFYADAGRAVLLEIVSKCLASRHIVFKINGLNRDITKIKEIFIRSPDGIDLIFSDVTLERKSILCKSDIHVQKFVLNGSKEKIDLNEKLKALIPLMRILRIFICHLSLGRGFLNIEGKNHLLDDLEYETDRHDDQSGEVSLPKDVLHSKINNNIVLDVNFVWDGRGECVRSDISIDNLLNSKGTLTVYCPEKDVAEYKINAKKDGGQLFASGNYKNFMHEIAISNAVIKYGDYSCEFSGDLSLLNEKVNIRSTFSLKSLLNPENYTAEISKNLVDIEVSTSIAYDFSKNAESSADIRFRRLKKEIGNLKCLLKNETMKTSGDIGWINIHGAKFKTMECKVDKFKYVSAKINGEDFQIDSSAQIGKGSIRIEKAQLVSEKGVLKSSHPFDLKKDTDCSFVFDFPQMDFWNKIFPISGSGSGSVSYKKGNISGSGTFRKIFLKNNEFSNLSISIDGENLSVKSGVARIHDVFLRKLELRVDDGKMIINGLMGRDFYLSVSGKISDSRKKISLENGSIKSKRTKFTLDVCNLDFEKGSHQLGGHLADKNEKSLGNIKLNCDKNEIELTLESLFADEFFKMFNKNFWSCIASGSLKLKATENGYNGEGELSVSKLVSGKDSLNLKCNFMKEGIKIVSILKNSSEQLNADLFVPLTMASDWSIVPKLHSNLLNCHIRGRMHLENLLELSDKKDARGEFDCDFRLHGSMANPSVAGHAKLSRACFVINDILLKNGSISLEGHGKTVAISNAEFVDGRDKKMKITGNGSVFFKDRLPNINTNLQLILDDFTLFDSDSMNVRLRGEGSIAGPVHDMLISGNFLVPHCKFQHFGTPAVAKPDDIIIENEIYVDGASEIQLHRRSDFFRYDISMVCPNINFVGNVFDMTLSGNLKLNSVEKETTLVGELKLLKGRLDLFEKRMNFTKGYVCFFKEYPFDPKSFFACSRNFGDISVFLEIKSSPKKGFSFNLYSNPSYSKDVILSKMLFGKEMKYLSVSEAAQLANAVSSFNQRGGYIFSILNTFQKMGFVDTISFASGESDFSSSLYTDTQRSSDKNGVNLRAGKYIHDNIFVSVNKHEDGASFDVDLSVTPKLSVKASSKGEAGVSWKYRY